MKKIDFGEKAKKNSLLKIKNIENATKQLEENEKYQLYFEKIFLGDIERKGENLIVEINSDWHSSIKWNELKLFDKILKTTSAEKINFEYDRFCEKVKGAFEKETGKIKYSFPENKVIHDYQLPYDERSLLVDDFCIKRNQIWNELVDSKMVKEREIEIVSENGNSVTASENKNDEFWEINSLKIDFPENKFEYNKNKKKEGTLTFSDAIFLNRFRNELEKKLLNEVKNEYNNFKKKALNGDEYKGFELKEFDLKEADNLFQGIWAYEKVCESYENFKQIGTEIIAKNLSNALTAANEFSFQDIVDKSSGIFIRNEENEKGKKNLYIGLYQDENLKDVLNFYNLLKSESEFKNFKNSNIRINFGKNYLFISSEGEKIKYKGETNLSEKEIYESLKKIGVDKIEINGKVCDFENLKKVSDLSRK